MKQILWITLTLLVGCQSTQVFFWGSYEEGLFQEFIEPGAMPPGVRIQQLQTEIQQALTEGQHIAPGIYAHIGYLAVIAGDKTSAHKAFEQEKALFPESSHFMDHLLLKLINSTEVKQ